MRNGLLIVFRGSIIKLNSIVAQVDEALISQTLQINRLAEGIAELNVQISNARGLPGNNRPNELLDRRDLLLRQLAENVGLQQQSRMAAILMFFRQW